MIWSGVTSQSKKKHGNPLMVQVIKCNQPGKQNLNKCDYVTRKDHSMTLKDFS